MRSELLRGQLISDLTCVQEVSDGSSLIINIESRVLQDRIVARQERGCRVGALFGQSFMFAVVDYCIGTDVYPQEYEFSVDEHSF